MNYIEIALQEKIIKDRSEAQGTQYDMVVSETAGRMECKYALLTLNNALNIKQTPQTKQEYDMWTVSGTTTVAIETKDRYSYTSKTFDEVALSKSKWDMLLNLDTKGKDAMVLFCSTFNDGVAMFWDVHNTSYKVDKWTHKKYTEKNGGKITEDRVLLSPSDAKYIVKYDRKRDC